MSEQAGYGIAPGVLGHLGARLKKGREKKIQGEATPANAFPWGRQEVELAREGFLAAHATPKAALVIQKAINLVALLLIIFLLVVIGRLYVRLGDMKVMVVRVDGVGRAEAVRIDTDYVPQEPELRDALERLVVRMFTRNGFEIPNSLEVLPLYLTDTLYRPWRDEVKKALPDLSMGQGLKRVRVLGCKIENPAAAMKDGTVATVRFATDDVSGGGAPLAGSAQGFEVILHFRTGLYPQNFRDAYKKDQWVVRNPLGIKVFDYKVTRYIGADVTDHELDQIWREVKLEHGVTGDEAASTQKPSTTNPSKP